LGNQLVFPLHHTVDDIFERVRSGGQKRRRRGIGRPFLSRGDRRGLVLLSGSVVNDLTERTGSRGRSRRRRGIGRAFPGRRRGESCAAAEKIRANSKNIGKQYWLDLRIQNFPFDCRTERIC